jgi:hypothetical protein
MHLAAWTICHFLEKYREMLLTEHPRHPPVQTNISDGSHEENEASCRSCTEFVTSLLRTYPGTEIIAAYHLYGLCREHLRQLSRAPMFAGSIERRFMGRNRKQPSTSDLAQYVVFGGIPALSKLSMLKGSYQERIQVIGTLVDELASAAEANGRGLGPDRSSRHSTSQTPSPEDATISPTSFHQLTSPLLLPLDSVSRDILSAVPQFDNFIVDSEEWVSRMLQLVKPEDQIVSTFGMVQNILAGKPEPKPPSRGEGEAYDHQDGGVEDGDVDYLAPVKGFE